MSARDDRVCLQNFGGTAVFRATKMTYPVPLNVKRQPNGVCALFALRMTGFRLGLQLNVSAAMLV